MSRTTFRPETDGFLFSNSWSFGYHEKKSAQLIAQIVTDAAKKSQAAVLPIIVACPSKKIAPVMKIPIIGPMLVYDAAQKESARLLRKMTRSFNLANYGLCGGMAFSALDYWCKSWVVPRGMGADDQPQQTTASGAALRNYIWARFIGSLQDNVATFLEWMLILHFPFGPGASWLRDQTWSQIQILKERIDYGFPVAIGLVGTTMNPFNNHQVLVYGYTEHSRHRCSLFMYDNNHPDVVATTILDFSGAHLSAVEQYPSAARGPLRGVFCERYFPVVPPAAVVLRSGLTVAPAKGRVNEPFLVSFTAANIGYHASPPLRLIAAGDEDNAVAEPTKQTIAEGYDRCLSGNLAFSKAGPHKMAVVADLGKFGNVLVKKSVPPEGVTQEPIVTVNVAARRHS
jgi:hypothetical protein